MASDAAFETEYPVTYQRETSPTWLRYAATLGGAAPRSLGGPFQYLELGCGRGYSSLLHAACHPDGEFHACERDSAAVATSRRWAAAMGLTNIQFHETTFEDLALPGKFDFIVLHGVYSWVDGTTRTALREVLRRHLAPAGLVYVSYNCLPGWTDELPLRRLLGELSKAAPGPNRMASAVREIEQLRAAGMGFFTVHPAAERAAAAWSTQPPGYLEQEYLAHSEPLWALDVMDQMADAGLRLVASATLRDQHEALLIDTAASEAIAALATPRLRTLALDFAVNRAFRRDVFASADVTADETALRDLLIGCPGDPAAIPESVLVPRGRIRFREPFVAALRQLMASGALPLGEAVQRLGTEGDAAETARNLLWLVAAGALSPFAQLPRETRSLEPRAAAAMLRLIAAGEVPAWIAAPAIGGGCEIDRTAAKAALSDLEGGPTLEAGRRAQLVRLGILPGATAT